MEKIVLSNRLQSVADMVTRGNRVCDVGCDHGYVSIYLVKSNISPKAIAMDIRKGPLSQADKNVGLYGVRNLVELRLSDGLEKLEKGEADSLIIAGMGGPLMQEILLRKIEIAKELKEIILQPQSEIPEFRHFLSEQSFEIIDEDMVLEDGKFYPMMKVKYSEKQKPENCGNGIFSVEETYGPILLEKRHPVLKEYLAREYSKLIEIKSKLEAANSDGDRHNDKIEEINNRISMNREASGV